MKPLIDGDILLYEVASVAQYVDERTEEIRLRPWEWVVETLEHKIGGICDAVGATEKPIIYLTGDEVLWRMKARMRPSLPPYKPNFRIGLATSKSYKGTRVQEKPILYNSIRAHLLVEWGAFVAIGCEADDEMAIEQTKNPDTTIICTRDKDLRQVPGNHYGWESGLQAEFGPTTYDFLGTIELDRSKSSPKIVGGGFMFFASQLLTGDVVDNIGGLPKMGPVGAFNILRDAKSSGDCLSRVRQEYQRVYPDDFKIRLREQCDLLWMIRERDEEGELVFFNPKEYV